MDRTSGRASSTSSRYSSDQSAGWDEIGESVVITLPAWPKPSTESVAWHGDLMPNDVRLSLPPASERSGIGSGSLASAWSAPDSPSARCRMTTSPTEGRVHINRASPRRCAPGPDTPRPATYLHGACFTLAEEPEETGFRGP